MQMTGRLIYFLMLCTWVFQCSCQMERKICIDKHQNVWNNKIVIGFDLTKEQNQTIKQNQQIHVNNKR